MDQKRLQRILDTKEVNVDDLTKVEPDSPKESYNCEIPPPKLDLGAAAIEGVPPGLPSHLQKVLLNSKIVSIHDPHALPVPSHVSVNHLYACSIRDGVMAIGTTCRYKKKVFFYI